MLVRTFTQRFVPISLALLALVGCAQTGEVSRDAAKFADWRADAPGGKYHIKPSDLPPPQATDPEGSVAGVVKVVTAPSGIQPKVPSGFTVEVFASDLNQPRRLQVAPNGDVFLAESGSGRVLVFRSGAQAPAKPEVFAENLDRPYGIAFVPPAEPRYVYVAAANQVVRYPYRSGAIQAGATSPEVIIGNIPTRPTWTRDLAVSRDGEHLYLSSGSAFNAAGGMPDMTVENIRRLSATHGRGATWGEEENRAAVLQFDANGKSIRNYANGLRNCSAMAMQSGTDNLWCVVNERDHLGPDLVPDYMTPCRRAPSTAGRGTTSAATRTRPGRASAQDLAGGNCARRRSSSWRTPPR